MSDTETLSPLFNPGSIAIIGASNVPGKISNIIIESLKNAGFPGAIYPVNPHHEEVNGLKCYPTVAAIGHIADIAVFAMPADSVLNALKDASEHIRIAVVIGGGFGEMGKDGAELEREIKAVLKKKGIRGIGPNCMGIFDNISKTDTLFIPKDRLQRPKKGGLSIISQSGSFVVTALDELATEGVGVARVISYGNKADINESDCLDFLADDEHTTAVAIHMESVTDGRRFVEAAARCAARKPVLAVKVGKLGAGITAARSHTGAIAGRFEAYKAAFRKAGVIEIDGYEDFIAGCKAFGMNKYALGNRVMIITDGGGMGVTIADACHSAGLVVPALTNWAADEIKALVPKYFAVGNPLDLTGSVTDEMYVDTIEKTMNGDSFDIAIIAALWGPPGLTDNLVKLVGDKADKLFDKPLIICSPGGEFAKKKAKLFRRRGMPVFQTPEAAVRAASILARVAKRP